jgi:glycosyltransferase involved in cell wall biosynthesis
MKKKIIRITTVPVSLKVLLKGQLKFMQQHFEVIAVSSPGRELYDVEHDEGVRVFSIEMSRSISPLKDILSILRMYRFFKIEKPYIVHSHTPKAGFVGMTAAYLAGVPNRLHTIAGLPLMETKGIKRWILLAVEKFTYLLSSRILPNSFGLKDFILENKLIKETKLRVLGNGSSNGIDLDYFKSTEYTVNQGNIVKKRLNLNGKFIFLFVGRIVSHKGINELVSAFLKVHSKYPQTILIMVGEYEEKLDPLSEVTLEKIRHESIKLVGYQLDVRFYLDIADVFVFPSYREGFPNVVLQACAFNLPCIVTDINGCNEIIRMNENGLIIPPKEEKELEKAMELLYRDMPLRNKLGEMNRAKVEKEYSQLFVWENLLNLYVSV